MVEYEYQNEEGERYSVFASMKAPPPERIAVSTIYDKIWKPLPDTGEVEMASARLFTRVYGNCTAHMGRSFPYAAKSLVGQPAAKDCETGKVTVGKKHKRQVDVPIVRSAAHEQFLAKKYGMGID